MREQYTGPLAGMIFKSVPDLGPSFQNSPTGSSDKPSSQPLAGTSQRSQEMRMFSYTVKRIDVEVAARRSKLLDDPQLANNSA